MNAQLFLVIFGLVGHTSTALAARDRGGRSDTGVSLVDLSDGSLKEAEQFVLDGKDGVFKYSIVGDANGLASCRNSQEDLIPQEVTLDIKAVEQMDTDKLLHFTVELSLSECARGKVSHLLLAVNVSAIVRTDTFSLRHIQKLCFWHSVALDEMVGKRVQFDLYLPYLSELEDLFTGAYTVTVATVDKSGRLYQAPLAVKAALRI